MQPLLVAYGTTEGQAGKIAAFIAERLRIRHHSAVELVNRLAEAGLVTRDQDKSDHRRVLLQLTPLADDRLADLSAAHLDELSRIEPMLRRLLSRQEES